MLGPTRVNFGNPTSGAVRNWDWGELSRRGWIWKCDDCLGGLGLGTGARNRQGWGGVPVSRGQGALKTTLCQVLGFRTIGENTLRNSMSIALLARMFEMRSNSIKDKSCDDLYLRQLAENVRR